MSTSGNIEPEGGKPPVQITMFMEAKTIQLLRKMENKMPLFFTGLIFLILGLIVAINFMSFTIIPEYVYSFLGIASGYGVYIIAYYYMQYSNGKLDLYRETVSLRNKLLQVGIALLILMTGLLVLNVFTPAWFNLGIGGTLIISAFLIALTIFSPKPNPSDSYNKS